MTNRWNAARGRIPAEIDTLRALTRGADRLARMDRIAGLIRIRERMVDTPGGDHTARSPRRAGTDRRRGGKRRVEAIRASFAEFLSVEHGVAEARKGGTAAAADLALALAELRERGDEFRALAESSPDMVARLDADMRFVYVKG